MINYNFVSFLTLEKNNSLPPHLQGGPYCFNPANTLPPLGTKDDPSSQALRGITVTISIHSGNLTSESQCRAEMGKNIM